VIASYHSVRMKRYIFIEREQYEYALVELTNAYFLAF
jgi:hypothetical protein